MADLSGCTPRTVFVNAHVTTLDAKRPQARGIAVEGGRIAALLDAVPAGLSKDVKVVDCAGMAIVPGFHDCHAHLTDTGLLAGEYDLGDCESIDAILHRVATLPDAMLFAGNYAEEKIVERRPPSMTQLDAAGRGRPVLLSRVDGHSCVVNSATFALVGAERHEGVERDAGGNPTGRLLGPANYAAQGEYFARLPQAAKAGADARAAAMALAAGITCVHHVIAWDAPLETLEEQYRSDAQLPVRVISKACTKSVEKAKRLGGRIFGGDIFLDGSIGSRTAAVHDGYLDGAGGGLLYVDTPELTELFDEASQAGLSLGVHAIGDRAIEAALAAWEAVIQRGGPLRGVRPAIDHFEVASIDQIARASRCGIFLSMQPAFDHLWGGDRKMYAQRFGAERALEMNRFATARKMGCVVCGGSDSPVTPFSALLGIHSLVNHHVEAERLSVDEALAVYCSDAAKLSFDEGRRGTLAPEMDADFVLLERPLHTVEPAALKDVRVIATVVGGSLRYDAR